MISADKGKVAELKLHQKNKEPAPKHRRNRGGTRLILFVCLAVVGYMIFSLGSQISYLHAMQTNVETIQGQMEELKQKNTALREEIKKIKSDAYVEQVAREQLGLVKPGETLVVPTQSPEAAGSQEMPKTPETNKQENPFNVRDKNIYD